MLDTDNIKVLSWMRQAPGAGQVVVSVNFTAEPQTVNLAIGGVGIAPEKVETLLKSPGGTDPRTIGAIELGPYGVFIGEVQ
jgi:alpha-glucosidase